MCITNANCRGFKRSSTVEVLQLLAFRACAHMYTLYIFYSPNIMQTARSYGVSIIINFVGGCFEVARYTRLPSRYLRVSAARVIARLVTSGTIRALYRNKRFPRAIIASLSVRENGISSHTRDIISLRFAALKSSEESVRPSSVEL